jgi:hypothetical protein
MTSQYDPAQDGFQSPVVSRRGAIAGAVSLGVSTLIPPGKLRAESIPNSQAVETVLDRAQRSALSTFYIHPTRILWQSDAGVKGAENLLKPKPGQALLDTHVPPRQLISTLEGRGAVLLDFGTELQGYIELFTPMMPEQAKLRRVRVRFGESASEAMSEIGGEHNATNDHAIRDQVVNVPWLGKTTIGPSGFRFVRIDNADPSLPVDLSEIRAVLQMRDIPYVGAFRCNDERLNRIWQVGAYTVHLNMQDYLWDGIKRDRLVWVGDMHPEVNTINAVFGFNEVVPKSLDLIRDATPVSEWMQGISSYSMWWVCAQEELWMHHGNRVYLEAQRTYLKDLLTKLAALIGPDGKEHIDGMRFLDWPSSSNPQGVTAGLQGLLVMTLDSGARLMSTLRDQTTAKLCHTAADHGRKIVPDVNASKAGAALLTLAGMIDAQKAANQVLKVGGPKDISTFYGFYVLQALAKSGDIDTALDFIRTYWGAMLDLGATTFWEDFNLEWADNAARIDELVPPGKKDIHGDCGAYCYKGFRHSLCHGWASGPTAWLSQNILGVKPLEPGFTHALIRPQLGHLKWAEGSYPTPLGPIQVRHERQSDGGIQSKIDAPQGVRIKVTGAKRTG